MRLTPKRYDQIQKYANNLMLNYCFSQFPVDLEKLITQLPDVELRLYSSYSKEDRMLMCKVSEDGFTLLKDETFIIRINDSICEDRQRYTIAHEIGHIVLGHHYKPHLSDEVKEAEADFFANRLLVPMWAMHCLTHIEPWQVSYYFGVSMECAYYRIKNYNSWVAYGSPTTELEQFLSLIVFFQNDIQQEVVYAL